MVEVAIEPALAVSAAAILIYDYLLTLGREVDLVWPSHISVIKILFFLTRYTSWFNMAFLLYYQLAIDISLDTCKKLHTASAWLTLFGFLFAEVILAIRTWTLWNRDKRLGIILSIMAGASATIAVVIEIVFLRSLSATTVPSRGGCPVFHGTPLIAVNFIVVILYETGILVLTLVKGVQIYRLSGDSKLITGLTRVLYRDGIIFYVYLFAASVVNFITIITAPVDKADMLVIVQGVLHSSLSARVILNLRAAGRRPTAAPALEDFPTEQALTSIEFGRPASSTAIEFHPLVQLASRNASEIGD